MKNRYRIGGVLAHGGMSLLYHATDAHLPGAWVVKQMRPVTPNAQDRDLILEQFRREAAILARLNHPGLPRVIDSFEEDGYLYLVEEMIPGHTLEQVATSHRFSEDEAVVFACELLDILSYLHEHEIIYRDLKPQNIMVVDSGPHTGGLRYALVDFGIARLFSVGKRRDTVLMGTPGFSSPEHYGQRQTDARSDIYSLGAVLHFLTTGRDPGEQPFVFRSPDEIAPGISEWLSDIIMKAVEREPGERFQTARAMREALDTPRNLVLRARTYRYPRLPGLLPRWERPLQTISGLVGSAGLAALGGGTDFLPISMLLLLHPALMLGRYLRERSIWSDLSFTTTPRELQIWKKDHVTRVPWDHIDALKVRKYQRFTRPATDIGVAVPRGKGRQDTSILIAAVDFWYRVTPRPPDPGDSQAALPDPGFPLTFRRLVRFTNELEGWPELLATILGRTGMRRMSRSNHPLADEEYHR